MEAYFLWRLHRMDQTTTNQDINKPDNLTEEEEMLAQQFYSEIMMRYLVSYSTFSDDDIYNTGVSKLLLYPDFQDAAILTNCLSLFENTHSLRLLLKECCKKDTLRCWIGEDLQAFSQGPFDCAVIAVPYYINKHCVGAIGLLGPIRVPYRQLFGLLRHFSESISQALTRSIYKFKITYRQPQTNKQNHGQQPLGYSPLMLIEHNRK